MSYIYTEEMYKGPILFKLPEAKTVSLHDRKSFLETVADPRKFIVYQVERFCYGDFDNNVVAVVKDKLVDPQFCRYYDHDQGIFKAGQTEFSIRTDFWYFRNGKAAFWTEQPEVGYDGSDSSNAKKNILDLETTIKEVFIISKEDVYKLSRGE